MPWSEQQMKTARAVAHGWKPRGSAKGFDKDFAHQVMREGVKGKRKRGRYEGKSLGDLMREGHGRR